MSAGHSSAPATDDAAVLAARDEPFEGPHGARLLDGLRWLRAQQKDGLFPQQGHTWIHGQGFATLALAEAYGRSRTCQHKPPWKAQAVSRTVAAAVRHIQDSQSESGGWWYTRGNPRDHEGSTTVCAVQALVSASACGIEIDSAVLERGFQYLIRCQNPDGGFDYKLGPGTASMKEGTAAGVATLALMKKFDYEVMMKGYRFLLTLKPQGISRERFPYYGHFYGAMAMHLLRQEFPPFAKEIDPHVAVLRKEVAGWQRADGAWPTRGWPQQKGQTGDYATALAALVLAVPDGRLSIFNR